MYNYLSNWFCTYCKVIILFSVLISYWVLLVAFSVVTVRYKMLMVIFTVQEKSEHPLQGEFRCNCPHPARSVIYCDGLSNSVQGFVLQNNRRWYQLNFGQKIRITDPVRCDIHDIKKSNWFLRDDSTVREGNIGCNVVTYM